MIAPTPGSGVKAGWSLWLISSLTAGQFVRVVSSPPSRTENFMKEGKIWSRKIFPPCYNQLRRRLSIRLGDFCHEKPHIEESLKHKVVFFIHHHYLVACRKSVDTRHI